jgi:hypothetical protein
MGRLHLGHSFVCAWIQFAQAESAFARSFHFSTRLQSAGMWLSKPHFKHVEYWHLQRMVCSKPSFTKRYSHPGLLHQTTLLEAYSVYCLHKLRQYLAKVFAGSICTNKAWGTVTLQPACMQGAEQQPTPASILTIKCCCQHSRQNVCLQLRLVTGSSIVS